MAKDRIIETTVRDAALNDLELSIKHHLPADLRPQHPLAYAEAVANFVATQVKFAVLEAMK